MSDDPARRVLVLGGSTEAFALARRLHEAPGFEVVTSLAGRTATPATVAGAVRTGGFGGPEGLARWIEAEGITAVVDATHPFTAVMPWNAAAACQASVRPRLRLRRPGWLPRPGDHWTVVADLKAAARVLGALGARRVFLTTGRTELRPFAGLRDTWFLVRSIEAPDELPLSRAQVLLDRGPFDLEGERAHFLHHSIDALVTKNSGGAAAEAKLTAARLAGVPVIMVARPPVPPGPLARSVEEAVAWCEALPLVAPAPAPQGAESGG